MKFNPCHDSQPPEASNAHGASLRASGPLDELLTRSPSPRSGIGFCVVFHVGSVVRGFPDLVGSS